MYIHIRAFVQFQQVHMPRVSPAIHVSFTVTLWHLNDAMHFMAYFVLTFFGQFFSVMSIILLPSSSFPPSFPSHCPFHRPHTSEIELISCAWNNASAKDCESLCHRLWTLGVPREQSLLCKQQTIVIWCVNSGHELQLPSSDPPCDRHIFKPSLLFNKCLTVI